MTGGSKPDIRQMVSILPRIVAFAMWLQFHAKIAHDARLNIDCGAHSLLLTSGAVALAHPRPDALHDVPTRSVDRYKIHAPINLLHIIAAHPDSRVGVIELNIPRAAAGEDDDRKQDVAQMTLQKKAAKVSDARKGSTAEVEQKIAARCGR